MNREEAFEEFSRLRHPRFVARLGMLCGATAMMALLGLSFVQPYADIIITVSIWPIICVGIYMVYILYRFRLVEKTLEETQVEEAEQRSV